MPAAHACLKKGKKVTSCLRHGVAV